MKKYLLNEPTIIDLLSNNKIVVVDGGARGEVFPPFKYLHKNIIRVLRFEPDANASIPTFQDNDLVYPKALWHSKGFIQINIAKEPSTSSVYPFNKELQKYIDPRPDKRITEKTVSVDAISLDELVQENESLKIDFIKLDIHGAEYEVLQGAKEVLRTTLGLLIESWVIPIHKGQKLRAHVESLAYDSEFYVFEEYERAMWARLKDKFAKRQPVALDTLFFKDPLLDHNVTEKEDAVKMIGIVNLFEHDAFAIQLTEHFYDRQIIDKQLYDFIITNLEKRTPSSLQKKMSVVLQKIRGRLMRSSFK